MIATIDLGSTLGADGALPLDALLVAETLIPDSDRREAILLALARKHDESIRAVVGGRGEEFVAETARDELTNLGLRDLAAQVRRLSEISDQLGYDVVAPRLGGKRRLEVKTSGRPSTGLFHFYVSRAEIDVGLRDEDWALVACQIETGGGIQLVGWCRARTLEPYLPLDAEGARWISAELSIPTTLFNPGLPTAI